MQIRVRETGGFRCPERRCLPPLRPAKRGKVTWPEEQAIMDYREPRLTVEGFQVSAGGTGLDQDKVNPLKDTKVTGP